MAELKAEAVFLPGVEVLSISAYIKKYTDGVTPQALNYAMNNDNVDYIRIGNDRFIVMTAKTRCYKPNESSTRDAKEHKPKTVMTA